jgi:hypothetical protein
VSGDPLVLVEVRELVRVSRGQLVRVLALMPMEESSSRLGLQMDEKERKT